MRELSEKDEVFIMKLESFEELEKYKKLYRED